MRSSRRVLRVGLAALLGALAGGCALLGGGDPPPATFDITAPVSAVKARVGAQILVAEPQAVRALDNERIVVKPAPGEVTYLARSQWTDRLPKLLQARLVETFENAGTRAVGRPGQGLSIDYQLVTDIRAFELDAAGRRAVVTISAKLMNDRNGKVVATEIFSAEEPAASDDPAAVTAALDAAFDRVAAAIARWAAGRI